MPTDQPLPITEDSVFHGLPPALQIMVAGCLCFGAALLVQVPALQTVLAICGATLFCVAITVLLHKLVQRLIGGWQRGNAQRMLAHDLGAGFVTCGNGIVAYANGAAVDRFDAVEDLHLADVLRDMLANPVGLLDQLQQQASKTGAAAEDIVTRAGHFRLRVLHIGSECHVWWLDDLTAGAQKGVDRGAKAGVFPMLSITSDGRILHSNAALRKLVGDNCQTLSDVLLDLPLQSGQIHSLRGRDGPERMLTVEIETKDKTRDIYFMPRAKPPQNLPLPEGGWDAIEDLPVPLLKVARDGRLLGSNKEARQLLHITSLEGKKISDVLDGPGRPMNEWLAEALAGRSGHASQFLRGHGANDDTFVQVTISAAGDPDNLHLIAVLSDVTELKTLEAQFVQSQKMQAIGQLAGGVAHDFNNLLTAISGHCDLLLLRHDEGDQNYGDLIQIHQNANRAASLVGQLLAFSRKQNLQPETIDLRDTLSELTHLLNRLVGEKVRLTLNQAPDLFRIKADKRQLEQVLMNLVVNARDAMSGAGEIKVVTKNLVLEADIERERATVPKGKYIMVEVIDNGHGIAPEKMHKIFEPFWTTKKLGEGTGLGLSTAYGIVKQTGGYIFAESEVGRGTTFTLLLPSIEVVTSHQQKPQAKHPAPPSGRADGVVLLVEDEAPVRAFASRALRLRGYTVLEADCAEAALDLLQDPDLHVDIFVTDVIMPGMDGPTWVRAARKDRPKTKVVFVSGYPEDAFDADESELIDAIFLPKPFSLTELTQTVQGQLETTLEPAE